MLAVVRDALQETPSEPLNFSTLATKAQVSRRTLYTHWGTIERVISDAVNFSRTTPNTATLSLPPKERLSEHLFQIRESFSQPLTRVAVPLLISQAATDSKAAETLEAMMRERIEQFTAAVAPVTDDEFHQIVGPLFSAQFLAHTPATDTLVESLVESGSELLGLENTPAAHIA